MPHCTAGTAHGEAGPNLRTAAPARHAPSAWSTSLTTSSPSRGATATAGGPCGPTGGASGAASREDEDATRCTLAQTAHCAAAPRPPFAYRGPGGRSRSALPMHRSCERRRQPRRRRRRSLPRGDGVAALCACVLGVAAPTWGPGGRGGPRGGALGWAGGHGRAQQLTAEREQRGPWRGNPRLTPPEQSAGQTAAVQCH